jgi:peptidoglycan hydrolase-like protein with peptidoglycan-binding domain
MRKLLHQSRSQLMIAALAVGGLVLPAAISAQGNAPHKKTSSSSATKKSSSGTKRTPNSTKGSKGRSKRVKGQAAPTPERITEVQEALARTGAYEEVPSGKWDDSTAEAMKKFQSAHGLTPTGKFDARTLQKLGLGSGTAGLGAPTPPPNAAANRLLSPKVQREEEKNEPE